jgi:hypothetical protein
MKRLGVAVFFLVLAGCKPELNEPDTTIREARVLAVRAEPAEAKPGERVSLTALYVDANGTRREAPIEWSLCVDRKPLAELGPVSRACVEGKEGALVPIGSGLQAAAGLPKDACRLFGSERPIPLPGEPAGRPVDPDSSGGYYVPFRLGSQGSSTFFDVRLTCALPSVDSATTVAFLQRYKPNVNPIIASLEVVGGATKIAPGATANVRVAWPGSAETYAYYDPTALSIVDRHEAVRVAWFATAGSFAETRTGRSEEESANTDSENIWTAPAAPGNATIWVVVRDDRGGVSWSELGVTIGQ